MVGNPYLIDPRMSDHDFLAVLERLSGEVEILRSIFDDKYQEWMDEPSRGAMVDIDQGLATLINWCAPIRETAPDPMHISPDRVRDNFIIMQSGIRFYPGDPRVDEIDWGDIAHGLALKCRWTGQTNRFYSVGRHSIVVANIAAWLAEEYITELQATRASAHSLSTQEGERELREEMGDFANRDTARKAATYELITLKANKFPQWCYLYGLIHDCHEAYLPDIARPIKHHFPQYRNIAGRIDECVLEKLGIPAPDAMISSIVGKADIIGFTIDGLKLFDPPYEAIGALPVSQEMQDKIFDLMDRDKSVTIAGQVVGWEQTKREYLASLREIAETLNCNEGVD